MLSHTICRESILERIQKSPFPQSSPEPTISDSATVEILRSRQESAPRDDYCFGDAVRQSQRLVNRAGQAPPLRQEPTRGAPLATEGPGQETRDGGAPSVIKFGAAALGGWGGGGAGRGCG